MKNTRLSKIIKEEQERPQLTTEEKKSYLENIKSFSKHGKNLRTEVDLVTLSEELGKICQMAERLTLEEADEWFDKMTINRNMKELKRINEEFAKTSKEAKSLQQRMLSLYEDMGHVLGRYFEVSGDDFIDTINKKPDLQEANTNVPDKIVSSFKKWLTGYKKARPGIFDNSKKTGISLDYQGWKFNLKYNTKTNKWNIDLVTKI